MFAHRFGPIRVLLAIALAISTPLCCCRAEVWEGALTDGAPQHHSSGQEGDSATGVHHTFPQDERATTSECGGEGWPDDSCGGRDRGPCDDGGPCDCGHLRDLKAVPDAPAPDVAGPAYAGQIPAEISLGDPSPVLVTLLRRQAQAIRPTAQSLLRQHCALIV